MDGWGPGSLVLPLSLADHHGPAAAGDFPGSAQLPGADYRALQPRECRPPTLSPVRMLRLSPGQPCLCQSVQLSGKPWLWVCTLSSGGGLSDSQDLRHIGLSSF